MRSEPTSRPLTGYVLKMYPRFSETFVVSEILAREAAGDEIVIFSLRPTTDVRFHPELARVRARVVHVDRPSRPAGAWEVLRATARTPGLDVGLALPDLADAAADDAVQALAVARLAREHGVTHLHAHFGSMATTVARLAGRVAGLPYSFTAHAKDIFHEDVDDADLARKLADAHHVVTVSDHNLEHLRTRFPAETSRLRRVYNGLELDRFPFAPSTRGAGPLRVAAVGRLVEKKGFDLLLLAVARLRAEGADLVVDVAGDGPLAEPLASLSTDLGLDDVVTFRGPSAQHEVRALLQTSDVFVAPCVVGADGNADGLPTVLLEAMASGVPCIASDVTGIPEVVHDGTGLLVPTGDVPALVDALRRVADPGFDARPLVEAARALVESSFDSHRLAADLAALEAVEVLPETSVDARDDRSVA